MTEYKTVLYEKADGVAIITMNRPDALNAFNALLRQDLLAAIQRADADHETRAILLTGAGRAFCVGADLKESYNPPHETIEEQIMLEYKPILDLISGSNKPVIAAVRGPAAGIGAAFAMACDLTIMSSDAYIYLAFSAIGLIPDGGATWHLVRALGYKRAFEAIVDGHKIPAARCVELGLANRVIPADFFETDARAFARSVATRAPLAVRYSKEIARAATSISLEQVIALEAKRQHLTITSADAKEGAQAFFEKRAPRFTGT
ncbi:MAG: enoyl-CoA hydratase/isomerase family protein [Burkholderiales bacterium]|nr:enoyl-CoA hydratase/isomerase family protein [Burkholderiales bacterium]